MAAADMATWRRQNSDPVTVELVLTDGSRHKGVLMLSRDKTIREFFNTAQEAFVDFDCAHDGAIVIAKSSVRSVRPHDPAKKTDQSKVDALAARQAELEKSDPYKLLGVATNIDVDGLRKAYIKQARAYHPDRFTDIDLPAEVVEYVNAMCRRINVAYEDIGTALEASSKRK